MMMMMTLPQVHLARLMAQAQVMQMMILFHTHLMMMMVMAMRVMLLQALQQLHIALYHKVTLRYLMLMWLIMLLVLLSVSKKVYKRMKVPL
jgi:hypothetical protein